MLIQFLLHIVGYDIWFYLSHLALHTRALWWIHRVHHERVDPVWTDTYHGHWLESAFQGWGIFCRGLPRGLCHRGPQRLRWSS